MNTLARLLSVQGQLKRSSKTMDNVLAVLQATEKMKGVIMSYRHDVYTVTINGKKYATDLIYRDGDPEESRKSRDYHKRIKERPCGSFYSHTCAGNKPEDLIQFDPYFEQFEFVDPETFVRIIKEEDLT